MNECKKGRKFLNSKVSDPKKAQVQTMPTLEEICLAVCGLKPTSADINMFYCPSKQKTVDG